MVFIAVLLVCTAQAKYIPDPIVTYKIDARLDAKAKTVQGREVITWRNHTQEAVPDLQFHLYLNAFKNSYSTFMREGGEDSRRVKWVNRDDSWGYQQVHSLKVDGEDLTGRMHFIQPDDGNTDDQTVMRVALSKPVPPGGRVTIEIQWTSKMPRLFARTGFLDDFFLVAQWYPKPCVFEGVGDRRRTQAGWNCHQFHVNSEFFADYGTFDVDLTVPSDFEIGATGTERGKKENGDATTTYNFYQEDVHDFTWTTQPKKQVMKIVRMFKAGEQVSEAEVREWSEKTGEPPEKVRLSDVKVTLLIQREHASQIERHFRACFAGIKWYGLFFGAYPYDVVTFLDPPGGQGLGAGGMEYPTFFTAGTKFWQAPHKLSPESVTVHEFGHQFWYGLVGNNEFEEAWLDEGFNSYSEARALRREYGYDHPYEWVFGVPVPAVAWMELPVPRYPWYGVKDSVKLGQYWEYVAIDPELGDVKGYHEHARSDAMQRSSWDVLTRKSYTDQAYDKPQLTLATLERLLGNDFHRAIRAYHQRYRFKHPDAQDFMQTMQEVTGRDLKWFFDQTVFGTGKLDYAVSFTSDEQPEREGLFDVGGKPQVRYDPSKQRPIESEVVVQRLGEMRFPVVVKITFEDGSTVTEHWDGQYAWKKFKYTGKPKVVRAEVDQEHAFRLEAQRVDNSFRQPRVELAAEKWYLRWVVWLQNVLMAFSFFG